MIPFGLLLERNLTEIEVGLVARGEHSCQPELVWAVHNSKSQFRPLETEMEAFPERQTRLQGQ
jgi:hypothetical protein